MHRFVPSTRASVYAFALLVVIVGAYIILQPVHTSFVVGFVVAAAMIALVEVAIVVWKAGKRRRQMRRVSRVRRRRR